MNCILRSHIMLVLAKEVTSAQIGLSSHQTTSHPAHRVKKASLRLLIDQIYFPPGLACHFLLPTEECYCPAMRYENRSVTLTPSLPYLFFTSARVD